MKYVFTNDSNALSIFSKLFSKASNEIKVTSDYEKYLDPDSSECLYDVDTSILVYSREVYDLLKYWESIGRIHLGLRGGNYGDVYQMEMLTIRKCRFFFLNHTWEIQNCKDEIKKFYSYDSSKDKKYILNSYKIYTCNDGIEALDKFDEDRLYGFDFESKSFPDLVDFEPVGIGISTETDGIYIDFRYYDSDEIRYKFMDRFHEWIKKHHTKLICYYSSFEVNALRRMFNYFYPLLDCMAMVRCDDRKGSLKLNAQNYLHISSWDDDQDLLMKALDEVFNRCKTFSQIKVWKDDLEPLINPYNEYFKLNSEYESIVIPTEPDKGDSDAWSEYYKIKLQKDEAWNKVKTSKYKVDKVLEDINNLRYIRDPDSEVLSDLKYESYFYECLNKILDSNFDPIMYDKYHGHPFAVTPKEITGLYCIYDAFYTINTFEVIDERYHYSGTEKNLL